MNIIVITIDTIVHTVEEVARTCLCSERGRYVVCSVSAIGATALATALAHTSISHFLFRRPGPGGGGGGGGGRADM